MPLGDFKLEMNLITLHQGENKGHNLTETQSRENLLTVLLNCQDDLVLQS